MMRSFGSGRHGAALILTFCAVLSISGIAFGQGGACPSGTNYINPMTGTLTTLSALGITNCYFIAASGSDSNAGTSEATPWLHMPFTNSCSNNCSTVQNLVSHNSTALAGTGFIFRGGDTWHFGNSSASPYTGSTLQMNYFNGPSGTAGHPIYYGVDPTWYSGGSWARPIFTGDNPTSTSTTLTSCPYQTPPGANAPATNDLISIAGDSYVTFDNFELTGLCESDLNDTKDDAYVNYGSATGPVFTNLYIHGWTHVAFSNGCSATQVCFNIKAMAGSGGPPGDTIAYCVIDGSDSDPSAAGIFFIGFWNAYGNVFRYMGQGIYRDLHVYHDNLLEDWDSAGDGAAHSNVFESDGEYPTGPDVVYNNIFRHICTPFQNCGTQAFWPSPPVGLTEYWFNNIAYDFQSGIEYWAVGQNTIDQGPLVLFNNIWENSGTGVFSCPSSYAHPLTLVNNFYINEGSPYAMCTSQITETTELTLTHATATSDGYTASETYAYSPTSGSSPTVGAGTNEGSQNAAYCSALLASSDPLVQAAGTACQSGTGYACTYNSGNHTVSCPAMTAVARPSTGKVDIGAYQFGDPAPPQPPTNVQATAH